MRQFAPFTLGAAIAVLIALAPLPASAQNAVGINAHKPSLAEIALVDEMGMHWVRMDADWWALEPSSGNYQWQMLDAAIDEAGRRGLRVFLTLAYTPAWVPTVPRERTDDFPGNDEPAGSTEWVSFVEAAVQQYRARGVTHFGLWNEPNLEQFWDGSIDAYVDKIALPGAEAVRRVCTDCVTLGPDLATVGDSDVALDRILTRGIGAFDIITHHTYNGWAELGHRPFDGDSFLNVLEMRRAEFTRESLREILDRHGYQRQVWITETGYRERPVGSAEQRERQVIYMRRVLEEQVARDWWTNTFFYELFDCGIDIPDCSIDGYGFTRPTRARPRGQGDYELKPVYSSVRDQIAAEGRLDGNLPPADREFAPPPPPPDAGTPSLDGGTPSLDGGTSPGLDAGTTGDGGPSGMGPGDSGGCATGQRSRDMPIGWLLVGGLLLWRRRQRGRGMATSSRRLGCSVGVQTRSRPSR